jgi:hypothetical protein
MDVYLDDIIIREKLYLSEKKLHFLCPELQILGRVITNEGIRMDPYKVDSVLNWKTPTNRDLLRGFLGSVGYRGHSSLSLEFHRTARVRRRQSASPSGSQPPSRAD